MLKRVFDVALMKPGFSWQTLLARTPLLLVGLTFCVIAASFMGCIPATAFPNYRIHSPAGVTFVAALVLLVILSIYYKTLQRSPGIFTLAWAALIILFLFMLGNPYWVHQYDFEQNTTTIKYYATHLAIPHHGMMAESHQAPLYYVLAATLYGLALPWADISDSWYIVQYLSFFFFSMFLLYGILSLLKVIPSRRLAIMGIAILLVWPGNILHSARISNNILIYLSLTGCSYHFMGWYRERSLSQLNIALIWMGVAFATQTSAVVLLASTATLIFLKDFKGKTVTEWLRMLGTQQSLTTHLKPLLPGLLILIVGLSAGYGRNFYNYLQDDRVSVIFGARTYSSVFLPSELFLLDIPHYITYPYIITIEEQDSVNSQFWGYFLRSMSFGQFSWNGTQQAVIMNCLILLMWCFLAFAMLRHRLILKQSLGWSGYFGTFLGYSIIALMSAKMLIHEWSYFWADMRYIYAIVVFFLLTYLYMLTLLRTTNPRLYLLGFSLLAAYGATSLFHLYLQLAPKI